MLKVLDHEKSSFIKKNYKVSIVQADSHHKSENESIISLDHSWDSIFLSPQTIRNAHKTCLIHSAPKVFWKTFLNNNKNFNPFFPKQSIMFVPKKRIISKDSGNTWISFGKIFLNKNSKKKYNELVHLSIKISIIFRA